mgnify:CR=1 FL=1
MVKKYSKCPRCSGLLEYLYTLNGVDIKMCADCNYDSHIKHDDVTYDTRLVAKYGE